MKRLQKKAWAVLFGSTPPPTEAQIVLFKKVLGEKSCKKCHDTFNGGAWNSFVIHLIDAHGVDAETAYRIIDELAVLRNKHWPIGA